MLRGKLIAILDYIRKEEKEKINNLNAHFKHLEEPTTNESKGQQKEGNSKSQSRNQ